MVNKIKILMLILMLIVLDLNQSLKMFNKIFKGKKSRLKVKV